MTTQPQGRVAALPQTAISTWENEGGAPPDAPQAGAAGVAGENPPAIPTLSNAELVQLRVRVIALENVIIALLARATDEQLRLVSELADHISPRPGFTPHPLTTRASSQMLHLVDRGAHFRDLAVP